jgi:exopolysaccharide production protein ExoQ
MPHHETKLTWLILAIISVLFFLADGHDLMRTVEKKGTIEQATEMVDEGSYQRRIALLGLFALATVSLMRKERRPFTMTGALGWLLIFYMAWAIFSLAWASDHRLTFRRLCVFGIFCISALAVAERFSLQTIIMWVFCSTLSYLAVGFFAEIALGTFHSFSADYRFSGTLQPNHQGINCVLLLFSSLSIQEKAERFRSVIQGIALAAILFLILTKSRTSFGCAIFVLGLYGLSKIPLSKKIPLFLGTGFFVCLLLLAVGNDFITLFQQGALMGRSSDAESVSTLTGRTPLWGECLTYMQQKPFQGYAYGGFWTGQHVAEISASQGWVIGASHSVYIEQVLQLGIIGLLTYIMILTAALWRAIKLLKRLKDEPGYLFLILFIGFCCINGLLESILSDHRFMMFLFMVCLIRVAFYHWPVGKRYKKIDDAVQIQSV